MKKFTSLVLVSILVFSAGSQAEESWLDSLKSMLGLGDSAEEVVTKASVADVAELPSMNGMITALTENLNVSSEQAEGGLGSLMNYVKNNVSSEKFSVLSSSLPGLDRVLSAVPIITADEGGMSGLLSKAAQYSDKLKGVNELKQQFEALGLSPEMITGFGEQAKAYLDTPQGQDAKKLLTDSLSSLI
ncbi:MAG: hypothetical protein ACI9UD_002802 [Glaciecola sp.]|jgi:hypothetical protein